MDGRLQVKKSRIGISGAWRIETMTTMHPDCSVLHQGYMAGLKGEEPSSNLQDYEDGWLAGAEDREKLGSDPVLPKYLGPCETPLKRGDEVSIPKGTTISTIYHGVRKAGRTYTVKLHDVYPGMPAYRDYGYSSGVIIRPTAPKLVWPGTGGYWSEADLNEVLP